MGLDAVTTLPGHLGIAGTLGLSCSTYRGGVEPLEGPVIHPQPHSWLVVQPPLLAAGGSSESKKGLQGT